MSTTATIEKPKGIDSMLAQRRVKEIETVVSQCNLAALSMVGRIEQAVKLAAGVKALRGLLVGPMMEDIMALQNTPLGFRTDKPNGGYDEATVREAVIEGLIRGLYPVANQFNIIAGRFYCTKEGYTSSLRDYPELRNLRLELGVPMMRDGGAIVKCGGTWSILGVEDSITCEIPIRVNSGMGADAILGKAERKLRARIWNRLTGSIMETPDGDASEGSMSVQSTGRGAAALLDKLGSREGDVAAATEQTSADRKAEPTNPAVAREQIRAACTDWCKRKGETVTTDECDAAAASVAKLMGFGDSLDDILTGPKAATFVAAATSSAIDWSKHLPELK